MRRVVVAACFAGAVVLAAGTSQAASIPVGGPNPNWTDDQKFEWNLGRMAIAAQMCGAYPEAGVLNRLARMSPYGGIGLAQMRGDAFYGPACVEITKDARELAAAADEIEEYLEATYSCEDDGCFGQSLSSDWQTHACGVALKSHLAKRSVETADVRAVTFANTRRRSTLLDFQAKVLLRSCEGSYYVDLAATCRVTMDFTRGDCEIAGVDGF